MSLMGMHHVGTLKEGRKYIDHIISYWKFNGNSNDSVGSNNGLDTDISYVSGLIGNCADFTASGKSVINVPHSDNLTFGDGIIDRPFSFVCLVRWINFQSSVGSTVFSKTVLSREYELQSVSGSLIWRVVSKGATSNRLDLFIPFNPDPSKWYHITTTYDGDEGLKLYIDGVLMFGDLRSFGTYVAMKNTGNNLLFGKYYPDQRYSLDGYLNLIALFDIELLPGEIKLIDTDLMINNQHLI